MAHARLHAIARVLWLVLGLNVAVAIAKLAYGAWSHALSISADGVHSLVDGAANVVGLIGISVSRRPPDANHPYGHRKYETFAALGIAVMLFAGCQEVVETVAHRLRSPAPPAVGILGYVVIFVTIAINVFVVWVERRAGRELGSELLTSDAAHTASDVGASLLVLASFLAARAGIPWADVAVASV